MRVLHSDGALSRADIAARTGISRTTISDITSKLLQERSIVVVDTDASGRTGSGRPAELLALDPVSGQFMGVDFGHRHVHVSVADASHDIIAAGLTQYPDHAEWDERLAAFYALVETLQQENGIHLTALQAIGVGVPGPFVNADWAPGERWGKLSESRSIGRLLSERFDAQVILDNNTRFAALTEAHYASDETNGDVAYIRISDGIGGGLVVDGRLVVGAVGLAGEFGHVRVADNSLRCRCGKDGCLETVASVPAVIAACIARGVEIANAADLRSEIARAHPVVGAIIRDAGVAIGRVLSTTALIVNPSVVVVGGELPRLAPSLLAVITETMTYELTSTAQAAPRVVPAAFSGNEGSLGAIAALFHSSPLLANYPEREPSGTVAGTRRSLA